jgi:Chaperone of endosialidase
LGYSSGYFLTTGDNNIDIGSVGVAGESNTIRIGQLVPVVPNAPDGVLLPPHTATFIAGIYGEATSDAASTTPVVIDMNGNLGTAASSERFKQDIKPMDKSSEGLLALKPVTFHYKSDTKDTPQFGLVAEEVAKVNPNLVVRDAKGEIYTVRYDAVNAMVLNEFLKEHRKVEEQDRKLNEQGATIAKQQKQIEALMTGLQKVSAHVETNQPSVRVVSDDQ